MRLQHANLLEWNLKLQEYNSEKKMRDLMLLIQRLHKKDAVQFQDYTDILSNIFKFAPDSNSKLKTYFDLKQYVEGIEYLQNSCQMASTPELDMQNDLNNKRKLLVDQFGAIHEQIVKSVNEGKLEL